MRHACTFPDCRSTIGSEAGEIGTVHRIPQRINTIRMIAASGYRQAWRGVS
jgi:hypothetical protein